MTMYELIAFSTESFGPDSVKYRDYTTSLVKANRFNSIHEDLILGYGYQQARIHILKELDLPDLRMEELIDYLRDLIRNDHRLQTPQSPHPLQPDAEDARATDRDAADAD